jgi:hypothetical protein
MTFDEAKEELKDWIQPRTGGLYNLGRYIHWNPKSDYSLATLDGDFDADTLMAIAVYMKGEQK